MMLKKTKGLTWPMLLFALATTLVYMGGLAALQHRCAAIPAPANAVGSGIFGRAAFGASDFQCHRMFRFYWFIFAFVMATLLGLLITSVMKVGLHFSRPFWVGMVTISIVLMMIASEFFLGFDNAFDAIPGGFWPDWLHNPWRAATAGAIMSVVSLVLLLLAVGTDWDRHGHGSRHHDDKMTDRHTVTTTGVAVPVENVRVVDQV